MSTIKSKSKLLMAIILLLALVLRVWNIDKVPVSLFGDELDVGYQAYSILKTGRDYMGNFLPIDIQSFAEFRTPLFIYSVVPSVAIFGITPLGIRLPAIVFGLIGTLFLYLLVRKITGNETIALIAALTMTISPWHLQYSRAAFEITELLAFYLGGLYFFLKGLEKPKLFLVSVIFLAFTPWIYSTAKLFLPLTLIALIVIWYKDLIKLDKRFLLSALTLFLIIVTPIFISTIWGKGSQRFEGLSIFSNQTIIPSIGFERLTDIQARDANAVVGAQASLVDKLFHNQVTYIGNILINNYLTAFSTNFLFINGESNNPRQSVPGMGVMYKVDFIFLILGLYFLIKSKIERKVKLLTYFLLIFSPLPAALTQEGGTHATRLMLMLPAFLLLVSLGIYHSVNNLKKGGIIVLVGILYLLSFIFYFHQYYIHYPIVSERWWQAGIGEAVRFVFPLGAKGEKIIISNADEPMLKYFLSYASYPPDQFQRKYPLVESQIPNIGRTEVLDSFYFTKPSSGFSVYDLATKLPLGYYYLASYKEIGLNLVKEPGRLPGGISLMQTFYYPSGNPAYYLFRK